MTSEPCPNQAQSRPTRILSAIAAIWRRNFSRTCRATDSLGAVGCIQGAVARTFSPLRSGCAPGTKHSSWPLCGALSRWFLFAGNGETRGGVKAAPRFLFLAVLLLSSIASLHAHQHVESWYADALACESGARTEVRMADGTRCDVLTASHAVEVEFAAKWCEAVGQSLNYASQTGKSGAIAIILERESDARFLQRLRALIAFHRLPLALVVMRPIGETGIEFQNLKAVSRPVDLRALNPDLPKFYTTHNAWGRAGRPGKAESADVREPAAGRNP